MADQTALPAADAPDRFASRFRLSALPGSTARNVTGFVIVLLPRIAASQQPIFQEKKL